MTQVIYYDMYRRTNNRSTFLCVTKLVKQNVAIFGSTIVYDRIHIRKEYFCAQHTFVHNICYTGHKNSRKQLSAGTKSIIEFNIYPIPRI